MPDVNIGQESSPVVDVKKVQESSPVVEKITDVIQESSPEVIPQPEVTQSTEKRTEDYVPYERFKELNDNYNKLKTELKEKSFESNDDSDELVKPKPKKIVEYSNNDLDIKLDEREFLKELNIQNSYDSQKKIEEVQELAKVIHTTKRVSYLDALRMANKIGNLDVNAEERIRKAREEDVKVAAIGTRGSGGDSHDSTSAESGNNLTAEEIRVANRMGIPLNEYKLFKI